MELVEVVDAGCQVSHDGVHRLGRVLVLALEAGVEGLRQISLEERVDRLRHRRQVLHDFAVAAGRKSRRVMVVVRHWLRQDL